MGTVLLVLHLLTAIFLVSLILMQRSGGGALSGLGGGTGASSFLNARGKGNLLTRMTAILATIFFITSISLSIYHKGTATKAASVLDKPVAAMPAPVEEESAPMPEAPIAEVPAPEAPSAE